MPPFQPQLTCAILARAAPSHSRNPLICEGSVIQTPPAHNVTLDMQSGKRMGVALAETINTAAGTMFTFKSATLTAVSFSVDFIILKTSWGGLGGRGQVLVFSWCRGQEHILKNPWAWIQILLPQRGMLRLGKPLHSLCFCFSIVKWGRWVDVLPPAFLRRAE